MKRQLICLFMLLCLLLGCQPPPTSPPATFTPSNITPIPPAEETPLKVATWNIEFLHAEDGQGRVERTQDDYERLAGYARQLDADIIALQEVDGAEAAQRVFSPADYNFFFSSRDHNQLTGFAVKKSLAASQNPDLAALGLEGRVRHGTDISVTHNNVDLRFLSIHLKSFCFDDPLDSASDDCQKLKQQIPILEDWIDARAAENIPFVILGDFNRRFDTPGDTFWPEIDDGVPANADLERITAGRTSQCWAARYPQYIDHIVLDRLTSAWDEKDAFFQLVYSAADKKYEEVLSDHCPIGIVLDVSKTE